VLMNCNELFKPKETLTPFFLERQVQVLIKRRF
jgi:hypothetical protein